MLDSLFRGLFNTALTDTITPAQFLLCVGVSLLLGLVLCAMAVWRSPFSRSLTVTLAILPAVVCVVILMGNGNVGTGVAGAGAFNLVRFRSAPGSAREIGALFVAMGAGLITGMGYLGYGLLFTLVLGAAMMLYNAVGLGARGRVSAERTLHITIPEDLDYDGVFDPVLRQYACRYTLTQVKTTNMGSLFKLTYDLTLKDPAQEKGFIDQLRLRNGNLEISLGHQDAVPSPSPPARTASTPRTATTLPWATSTLPTAALPSPPRGTPSAPRGPSRSTGGPLS